MRALDAYRVEAVNLDKLIVYLGPAIQETVRVSSSKAIDRRSKGLVSTVLCMCQFKTNEYTQTTLVGVELMRVTFYV